MYPRHVCAFVPRPVSLLSIVSQQLIVTDTHVRYASSSGSTAALYAQVRQPPFHGGGWGLASVRHAQDTVRAQQWGELLLH